jgi:hypothetical protein
MFNPSATHLEPTEQQSYVWTDEGPLKTHKLRH